jgi:hypothetical protein
MPKTHRPVRSKKSRSKPPIVVPVLVTAVATPNVCLVPAPPQHNIPHIDITGATLVEVETSKDGTRLWVNVNGVCVLRCCQIKILVVKEA